MSVTCTSTCRGHGSREHDAHVTIRCGGTKLWCARDARDLLKALAAFNKGAPKEKKTKLKAVRKSRRRS